jgi:hypothetical protein
MVCLGNMCVDTLHKGDNDDDDDNNIITIIITKLGDIGAVVTPKICTVQN